MDSNDSHFYSDQPLNPILKLVQRFNPRQKKDFFSAMDTTSKSVSPYFPAGGLTASITCFLRLYPRDCFLTKICHLR